MGMPAVPQKEFQRGYLGMLKLGVCAKKIRKIEKQIDSRIEK